MQPIISNTKIKNIFSISVFERLSLLVCLLVSQNKFKNGHSYIRFWFIKTAYCSRSSDCNFSMTRDIKLTISISTGTANVFRWNSFKGSMLLTSLQIKLYTVYDLQEYTTKPMLNGIFDPIMVIRCIDIRDFKTF